MLKGLLKIFLNIIAVIVLFVLQLYVFNDLYIFDVRFNVIAAYCVALGLLNSLKISIPASLVLGFVTDIILGGGRLKYILIYIVVVLVIESLKSIYRLENSKSIIIYTAISFGTIELLSVIFNYIDKGMMINIFYALFNIIKIILINIPLVYVMFVLAIKVNQKLER